MKKFNPWLWLLAVLLTVLILGSAAPTRAQVDHHRVVGEEMEHIRQQGFDAGDYGMVVMDSNWEGATAFFGRGMDTIVVVIADDRWTGHTKAVTAHEIGHVLVDRKGLEMEYEAEETFVQNFAACYGSYSARVWLRIREGVRPTREQCEAIRVQLGGKPPAPKTTVPEAVMETGKPH